MIQPATLLLLLNLLYIGILPRIFFRKDGRLGPLWWATAAPFIACAAFLLAGSGTASAAPLELASVTLSAASIALISVTLGSHRVPLALWHQSKDLPAAIVTHGPYRRIRHPFYAAFLLALLAALVHSPHAVTAGSFAYGLVMLNATAAREERRLLESPFGAQYRAYMQRAGRFLPLWRPRDA
jgi:protein-S-isoprenylcysteine O-methyltransferase Ste14